MCVLSCFTHIQLYDAMDYSLPGSSVHGILHVRILERAAIPPPGDLPDSGIKPVSRMPPEYQEGSLPLESPGNP